MFKNNKGFSLIEVLIVVAILGVLSAVAIPQYTAFRIRAAQKEGYALLNTYYTASQTAHGEHGFFPGNFVDIGFQPVGILEYRLTARQNRVVGAVLQDGTCVSTGSGCNCAGACPSFKTWSENMGVLGVTKGATFHAAGVCGAFVWGDHTFQARVSAVLNPNSPRADVLQINQGKEYRVCLDGTN